MQFDLDGGVFSFREVGCLKSMEILGILMQVREYRIPLQVSITEAQFEIGKFKYRSSLDVRQIENMRKQPGLA